MITRHNHVAAALLLLGGAGASFLVGSSVVTTPGLALAVCSIAVLGAAVAFGPQAVLWLVVVVFPVVPSTILIGSKFLTPQRVLVGLLLLVVVADPWARSAHAWRIRVLGTPLRYFCVFLAVGLLSAVASPLPGSALGGIAFYAVQVGGVMVAASVLAQAGHLDRYSKAISVAAIGVGVLVIAQYLLPRGLSHVLGPVFAADGTLGTVRALPTRVSGPFSHPVALGAYGALTLPFAFRAALSRDRRCSAIGKAAVVALLVAILLSQTRMAMFAALAGTVVWLATSNRRRQAAQVTAVAAIALVGIFGISTLGTQANILRSAFSSSQQSTSNIQAVRNVASRRTIYSTGRRSFRARPLLGYGMRVPTNHAQRAFFTQYGNPLAFESYLVVLPLEVGIIGVAAFLAFMAALVHVIRRHVSDPGDRATLLAALCAGFVIAIGTNLFDANIAYLWLLIGLTLGTSLRRAPPEVERLAINERGLSVGQTGAARYRGRRC